MRTNGDTRRQARVRLAEIDCLIERLIDSHYIVDSCSKRLLLDAEPNGPRSCSKARFDTKDERWSDHPNTQTVRGCTYGLQLYTTLRTDLMALCRLLDLLAYRFSCFSSIFLCHGLYGSTSCCISHRPFQWERAIFDPPQLRDPWTDFHET